MSNNKCGFCKNFKPKKGAKFFDCTSAVHASLKYGMQVRADTRACDAFVPSTPSPMPSKGRAQPAWRGLRWKALLLILLILAVGLLSWGLYTLFSNPPLPSNMPTPTPIATSTPTPLPPYFIIDFPISASTSAIAPDRMLTVYSATRTTSYPLMTGAVVTAPPGTIFIIFKLTAMNLGKAKISIQSSDFSLSDSGGHQFTAQVGSSPYYVGDPFGAVLAPTQTDDGKLLYLIPIQASGLELTYLLEPASVPPVIARWKLNYYPEFPIPTEEGPPVYN